ncbi:hypothetical protein SLS64_011541 [Diaporthe eres]
MVKIEGGGIDDYKVAQTSSCFPTVGNNMAGNDMLGDNFAAYDPPKSYIHYDDAFERWISGHFVALDNPREHDPHISPLYNQPLKSKKWEKFLAMNAGPWMHKFMQFPTEIRLMIWEMAIEDAIEAADPVFKRSVQRFGFNLAYDARRVKPGQDKSWGWVACFTPLSINANRPLLFLRASVDSRALLLRKMSFLTVHELPIGADGQYMAPRKCHMPFDFAKDDFCVEGITHGLEEATRDKADKDAVWDPEKLPLADLLDNALGLRFAPRIKRLAIVPHLRDMHWSPWSFIQTTNGRNMATIAKRFPALVTVKSAIPQRRMYADETPVFPVPRYILWKAASLRGKGKGGPSKMSEEDREALYLVAWRRIFDQQHHFNRRYMVPILFDDSGCLV